MCKKNLEIPGFSLAVARVGGITELVRQLNDRMEKSGITYKGKKINRYHISRWLHGKQQFPAELAGVVEDVTGVTKERLRPDIFQ